MLAEKKAKIRQKRQETKEKRNGQVPTVIQCKLQNLSKTKRSLLEKLFLEAKWLYNWLVADINRVNLSTKDIKEVEVKVGNVFEKRELTVIGSQIKQGLQDRIKQALKGLKNSKANEHRVGKLKFKSRITSIPLKQYGMTYKIDKQHNRVKIQGLGSFRALGLRQISEGMEIANGVLVKKADGYYLHITCYKPKTETVEIEKPIAIDFGIENKINLSNGVKIDFEIPETRRLKVLQQKLAKKVKGSKNYRKLRELIQREHLHIQRIRKEIQNKVIALAKRYSRVIFQDDNIKSWHERWFGRQVQSSGIGGITERIKNILSTPISVIDRYQTTSKICFFCGSKVEISLSDRIFRCSTCGYEEDRDINSARNMLRIALNKVEEIWLTLTEKEIKLIEKLFSTVKEYVKITISSGMRDIAYPTVGPTGSYALGKGSSSL